VLEKQKEIVAGAAHLIDRALAEAEFKRAEVMLAKMQDLRKQLDFVRDFQAKNIETFENKLAELPKGGGLNPAEAASVPTGKVPAAPKDEIASAKKMSESPLPSAELKHMQAIEPNFIPKDSRAVRLFELQESVRKNEENIKSMEEEAQGIRPRLARLFRETLSNYAEDKLMGIEAQHDASTIELINKYEVALKNNPDSSYASDAMYFLGYYYFLVDEKDYFDRLAKYNEAREQGREDVPYPEENFLRTIDLYESLIQKYPDFRHMDGVYYLLGMALWYEGVFSTAVDDFKTLLAKFPNSKYVEEVWFRLGEFYYDMDEFDNAIHAYSVVTKNKDSRLLAQSFYKIGWSHFQKDQYSLAVDYFAKVLDLNYAAPGTAVDTSMRSE
ncbi:MAG: tetratricopeptide repeat protein, partial [Minisyncoccia bacterium]